MNRVKIFKNSSEKSKRMEEKLIHDLKLHNFEINKDSYDLAISIGGDGTFLRMVNETGFNENIYYVGINTGSLGFLQEVDMNDSPNLIEKLSKNEYKIEDIYLQETKIVTKNKEYTYLSLNEIVIRRIDLKVLECLVKIDDEILEEFVGDGLLISTNIGSTAYNMSLGGSIIDKSIKALSLTPIAPIKNKIYKNLNNSIVLSEQRTISIEPIKAPIIPSIDSVNKEFEDIIKIESKISNHKIKCLKINHTNFIKTVHDKLIGN